MVAAMKDWAVDYLLNVLERKDWSVAELARRAGVSQSTLSRPIARKDWPGKLSRDTIARIHEASGIDPAPFAPSGGFSEPPIAAMLHPEGQADGPPYRVAFDGRTVEITAKVDADGLDRLLTYLETIRPLIAR